MKQLLIANGAIFLLFALCWARSPPLTSSGWVNIHFGLVPTLAVLHGWIWQFVTYAFLHAGLLHILFNMLALWMFGAQLEMDWGYNLFMQFYFFCVIGAAICTVVVSFTGLLGASPLIPTVGASGGIYGLLLAFGILHGDSEIMLFPMPFLIKARYFVIGLILPGDVWSAILCPQPGAVHRLHGAPRRRTLRLYLPEVRSPPRLWLPVFGALLRIPQLVLPVEAQARRAQVRGLHAQA